MAGAVEFSLDAQWRKNFSRDVFRSSQIALTATVPLFDGGRSRESVRAQQDNVKALEASLKQAERSARSEIISTSLELQQNAKRLVVANAAFEAAKVNFDAASESRRLGAGTLLEVITAQLSLTTAESNLVQARYDYLSSKVRFDVATGKPIEGEE
ncbi:MAG: TolC family protein [Chthonomonas sp.]|nr:TolC family protein [Chthonomonas sp.]